MFRLAWLFAPSLENVSFAIRCCVSMALALYLAFWLQLDNAYWVFINVAILIQPLPGFLVVRGFARLLGTVVAGVVSIALIAMLGQSYVLFSIAVVAWVSTMVLCASMFRNNMAYGFVLAGYVAMIVGVRAMGEPSAVFSIAVARVSETALAVVVTAVVSVLLAPGTTAKRYFKARAQAFKAIGHQLQRLSGQPANRARDDRGSTPHPDLHALVQKTLALEQTRRYARFDAPGFAAYDRLARRVNYELLAIVSAMASLQVYLDKSAPDIDREPLHKLDAAAGALIENPADTPRIKHVFSQAYRSILANARADRRNDHRRSLPEWVVISRALDLANRIRAVAIKHGLLLGEPPAAGHVPRGTREFAAPLAIRESLRTTARAATAMAVGAAIWATHGEPALNGMMVLLAVLTTLFALGDDPVGGARGFGIAALCAGVAAFIVNFILLPAANSYALLMVVLMPFVFVAGLAMATPSLALIGRVSLLVFGLLVHPANAARQDFVGFAQALLGAELAVILALTAFVLIIPISAPGLLRERLAAMFGELAKGFTGSRERFETRVYERLLRLPTVVNPGQLHISARQAAFAAVNMGLEARALRLLTARGGFALPTCQAVDTELQELAWLFEHGYPDIQRVRTQQQRAHQLAQAMLDQALTFTPYRRMRYAIRAAVAAELVAAALADYAQARDHGESGAIRPDEPYRAC